MGHKMIPSGIKKFTEQLWEQECSRATIEKYSREVAVFYRWLPEGKEVDKPCVMRYKAELIEKYAPASVNAKLSALRAFFSFVGWQECVVNLLKLQKHIFSSKEKELTKEEYKRLVDAAERRNDTRLSLVLQIMASTGIRVSEIRHITVEAAQNEKAEISLKGKVRVILLPGKLCRRLLKYAKKQKITSGQIILTRSGRPMGRKEIWASMKSLCLDANVGAEKVFPHNLRHLFARTYYAAQKDIAKLADILGHSNIETTRIYLLTSGQEHQRDIERLGFV